VYYDPSDSPYSPYVQKFQPLNSQAGIPDVYEILRQQSVFIAQLRQELENVKQFIFDRPTTTSETPTANIRMIHAVIDAPAVDIWVDGKRAISNLSYRMISRYMTIPTGEHQIKIVPHNRTTPVLIHASVRLDAGVAYSILAIGTIEAIRPMVTVDTRRSVAGDFAHISIIHASADTPGVDIVLHDGRKVVSNLSFGQITSPIEVPAGPFSVNIRIAGTNQTVLTAPVSMLRSGVSYTGIIMGSTAGKSQLEVLIVPNGL
jgi:Domain of unknown function (DUF4397)